MEYHQKGGMFFVDAKGFSVWQPEGAAGKKVAPAKAAGKGGKKAEKAPVAAAAGVEEPKSRVRYDRLREIELEMQAVWAKSP